MYTVITNGFSSCHRSCTIQNSRGQRYLCHFLCQRSWVTCGKDIDQGRLIYVPALVSTVDFLFLFMSCALFLRSRICVRWNSTARQLRKSGEDYDIIHTFYWQLPHSVCFFTRSKKIRGFERCLNILCFSSLIIWKIKVLERCVVFGMLILSSILGCLLFVVLLVFDRWSWYMNGKIICPITSWNIEIHCVSWYFMYIL